MIPQLQKKKDVVKIFLSSQLTDGVEKNTLKTFYWEATIPFQNLYHSSDPFQSLYNFLDKLERKMFRLTCPSKLGTSNTADNIQELQELTLSTFFRLLRRSPELNSQA